jgi:YggT family protein
MLYSILAFMLDVAAGIVGGACLLRLYMQQRRVPFGNPLGRLVFVLTDWLVPPIRRWIPAAGPLDLASLLAAYAVKLVQFTVLWLMAGRLAGVGLVPALALFGLGQLVLTVASGLIIVQAILSWVQDRGPMGPVLHRLTEPLLGPIQRRLPQPAGIDLSPMVALLGLQAAAWGLASLQHVMLR